MKYFLLVLMTMMLLSCEEVEYEYKDTNYSLIDLKLDDDSEYHFVAQSVTTGSVISEYDVHKLQVYIIYSNVKEPIVIAHYQRRKSSANGWYLPYSGYTIKLPIGYKIEIFND